MTSDLVSGTRLFLLILVLITVLNPPNAAQGADLGAAANVDAARPSTADAIGWVDLATVIWFHPAMQDYSFAADTFKKSPPAQSSAGQVADWRALLDREFQKRKTASQERLQQLKQAEEQLRISIARLENSRDRDHESLQTVPERAMARMKTPDLSYFTKRRELAGSLQANLDEQEKLMSEANEIGLQPVDMAAMKRAAVLSDCATAIHDAAQAAHVAVVFPSFAVQVERPPHVDDPSLVEPGMFSNSYQFALIPHSAETYSKDDLAQIRQSALSSWYADRAHAIPFAAGDSLLEPILVSGRNLTRPVVELLLKRGGVAAGMIQSVLRVIERGGE